MTTSQIDPQRLARLERLADRDETLDSLRRFARGIDRFDRESFLSAFHTDCVIAAGSFVGGPVELWTWSQKLHDVGQSATQHYLLNHNCEVEGDVAHCETYYLFLGRNRDETNWMAGGRYVTRQERRDGVWRIALHTNAFEWAGMLPTLPLPFSDVPDLDENGIASRDTRDLSYVRPLANRRKPHVPAID
jgi:hypothetical protein